MKPFKISIGWFFLVLVFSCSTDAENLVPIEMEPEIIEPVKSLTAKQLEFIDEYHYVTFNLAPDSYGATVNEKWGTDVKLFLDGDVPREYSTQVETALNKFNDLLSDGISFQLVATLQESNIHLIFGEKESIREVWPDMFEAIGNVNFTGYALYSRNGNFNITRGRIWVKNVSIPLFNHELGHTIGLGHASGDFCERDFSRNQSFMCSFLKPDFSVFDKAIIKTLYSPEVEVGLTFSQLKPILEELLLTDVILVE
ncbi:hypothetical protein FEE95_11410 [Maribacter algarum]|uniref:Dual-action HEIGH metallo-peptidase n=1 Tax=Maribacter algarum (ex Zhang et al. 2020) TaxID=2578118 RepID=A0A5S3PR00_9FLAO|nr:hypothetical protein [Maribacter algarum]TMM57091.1 hypothetical protein FEE95_11410 [Maribacter algarum]